MRTSVAAGLLAALVLVPAGPTGAAGPTRPMASPTASPVVGPGGVRGPDLRLRPVDAAGLASGSRALAPGTTTLRTTAYSLVAVTWRGAATPRVSVSAHGRDGWQSWVALEPLADLEGASQVSGTEPLWVGRADGLRVRLDGTARHVRVVLIDPGADPAPAARGATPPERAGRTAKPPKRAPRPELHQRTDWGANERWRNSRPKYNRTLQQVHLHHTATTNDYRRRDVRGILRSIYRYHTHNLGWSDIGYNFLVDRFGRAWVGRAGGAGQLVRGAHTLGFNHTSVGIAVIGNLEGKKPRDEVIRTLVHLAAWKLDAFDRDPRGEVAVFSHGSDLYADGEKVRLPVIDGHRDTNQTACPGQLLYDRLPAIRSRAGERVDHFS